jgi:glutamate mutase epsilon subunit
MKLNVNITKWKFQILRMRKNQEFYAEKIQSLVIDHEITAGKYNDIISKVFENCLGELKQKSKMYRMKFFPTN